MPDKKSLLDIFNDDPFGLLNVKPSASPARNEDERLVSSFQEIIDFYEKNKREPKLGGGIQEHQLYSRLKGIREDQSKMASLKQYDKFGLLTFIPKEITSISDILNDDSLGILNADDEGLFNLVHVNIYNERESPEMVARRKPCKDFQQYEPLFKACQADLKTGKRRIISFSEPMLKEGVFFVLNGIIGYLEKTIKLKKDKTGKFDGRTRIIFENGTESEMLFRSLGKGLFDNGKLISENVDKVNEIFAEKFSNISEEDKEAGYIYVLKSRSDNKEIREIEHLYKIGYSKIDVAERIKNASQEPTYLMAPVTIVTAFKCFNMNPQKFEQLIHNFFGNSCLNIDIFDNNQQRHTPREWFIAPIDIIQQAIQHIISGEIIRYRYDSVNKEIISR